MGAAEPGKVEVDPKFCAQARANLPDNVRQARPRQAAVSGAELGFDIARELVGRIQREQGC